MLARPRPVLARDVIRQLSRTERPEFAPPPEIPDSSSFLRVPGTFVASRRDFNARLHRAAQPECANSRREQS